MPTGDPSGAELRSAPSVEVGRDELTAGEHLARLAELKVARDRAERSVAKLDDRIREAARSASLARVSTRAMARATGWSASWLHAHYLGGHVPTANGSADERVCHPDDCVV
jgi:hypothetical protein